MTLRTKEPPAPIIEHASASAAASAPLADLSSNRTRTVKRSIGEGTEFGAVIQLLEVLVAEVRGLRADLARACPPSVDAASQRALIGAKEVAALLGVSDRELRRLRAASDAPSPLRGAGRPRWRRSDVERWIATRKSVR